MYTPTLFFLYNVNVIGQVAFSDNYNLQEFERILFVLKINKNKVQQRGNCCCTGNELGIEIQLNFLIPNSQTKPLNIFVMFLKMSKNTFRKNDAELISETLKSNIP